MPYIAIALCLHLLMKFYVFSCILLIVLPQGDDESMSLKSPVSILFCKQRETPIVLILCYDNAVYCHRFVLAFIEEITMFMHSN